MSPARGALARAADVRRLLDAARAIAKDRGDFFGALVASTGLSPEGVDLALREHLEVDASDAEIAQLVARSGDAARVAVVLSANVFVGALRAIAVARAASEHVVVRPSRRDPAFARALVAAARAAGDVALELDEALDVATVDAGEIHVYGRDETIASVRAASPVGVVVRGHGSGMGVALVGARADLDAAARALAADVVVFDQRGCLSPRVALVQGDASRADAFAEALHAALEDGERRVPRGELPAEQRAAVARYVDTMTYACRALVGRTHAVGVGPAGAPLVLPPPHRNVHVAPHAGPSDAAVLLAPFAAGIVAVGSDDARAAEILAPPRARVSALGAMQRPPFDGPVDLRTYAVASVA